MNEVSLWILGLILLVLVISSGFFSATETAMMSVNRYRLRHKARHKHRSAQRVLAILDRVDRLLGAVLIGNTFVTIFASAVGTLMAIRIWGDNGVWAETVGLTLIMLIFAEVAPKTLAAQHAENVSYITSWPLKLLLFIMAPLIWGVNTVSNALLKVLGLYKHSGSGEHLSQEELRTVVYESSGRMPRRERAMLLRVMDLQRVTVNDIMIARKDLMAIELDDDIETIRRQIITTQHTRLPVFDSARNDNVRGFLHNRTVVELLAADELSKEALCAALEEPYFVPEGTLLTTQLLNFQKQKKRMGLVVDEYGDLLGLITLEDILEEIVGDFTTDLYDSAPDAYPMDDGSFIVDGSANVRDLNREMQWYLPTDGPKTVSGLIIEHLEMIPENGTGLRLAGYPIEVIHVQDNMVRTAKIYPELRNV